ncbi:hypothetical protein sscle_03g030790 [Sclerotinia sclerotiorum 1980 UF-70]|uniref:Uncharacterized protein n=1 Tax=Sclerotinia sclerotiorum (strain ATCC 18683 / 1980 / Ss-1) TaxID=665079 RepID=A0A1D9Q0C4_SCLS1|nr:hypothetical protein sscle_03g030790 [Sclerotinia sclerotiorum 1980 UF-70]
MDVTDRFNNLYYYTPYPSSSIGNEKSSSAGSFTGFVCHKNEIYGLTSRHILFPESNDPDSKILYKYEDDNEKLRVCIPALIDHQKTKKSLLVHVRSSQHMIEGYQRGSFRALDPELTQTRIKIHQRREERWASSLYTAIHHDPNIGHIYAAPEKWRRIPDYEGFID